jgi:hypothetical protein
VKLNNKPYYLNTTIFALSKKSIALSFTRKHKILLGIIILLICILVTIPLIAKYYINNNGKELIGRKINLESLSINYFSGSVNLENLSIYEVNDNESFLYIEKLHLNLGVFSSIRKEYTIEDLEIEGLNCHTVLTDSTFNFNSIIEHFTDTTKVEEEPLETHYFVEKLALKNSSLSYYDKNLESKIVLNKFNISLPKGLAWNDENINVISSFNFTTGGSVKSNFNYNLKNSSYELNLNSKKINLSVLLPYVKDFVLIKELKGSLSTDLFVRGNTEESADMDIIGTFEVNDIALIDTFNLTDAALKSMRITADSINPAKDIYKLSAVKLDHPFARYEMFPESDNFTKLFKLQDTSGVATSEAEIESNVFVMIKDYVVETLHGIKASNFSIDTVSITNIEALYLDHTMLHPFKYKVSKANLKAYNVKSNADSLLVNFDALLNEKGVLKATGILHPQNPEDVSITMIIDQLNMKDLSPYFIQHLAFPATKGVFNMNTSVIVLDKKLNSKNNLLLKSFKLGKKQKHPDAYNLPVKVGIAMLKDREGNIVLDIPVEGNLGDPKYKVWKTIGRIFKELLLKAASSPYNLVAGAVDTDEESKKRITIDNLTDSLNSRHQIKLDNLAKVLNEKPELTLLIDPYYNLTHESKKLAFILAKAEFIKLGVKPSYNSSELNKIYSVNSKDSLFIKYINSRTNEGGEGSLEDKAYKIYTPTLLKEQVETYIASKLITIYNYLSSKEVSPTQIEKSAEKHIKYDQSANKNVQYHLQFDVSQYDE